ncbi:hypothetical protein [Shewanella sp. UCD-KL12]|uniref:hypothetical protein n=1 Tax=Shewanella sp. UCD-KL12 TaxID=1917163 RepID=UPI00097142D1|nr:hypothetical protein [Shewanella sp. UCD-KL12]
MKTFVLSLLAVSISACSGVKFQTNMSPDINEHIQSAASADKVIEYSAEEIQRYRADSLGLLVSSFCQSDLNSPKPSRYSLKQDLKYQTQKAGGNGFVVMECIDNPYPGCNAFLECRALAYSVSYDG